MVAFFGWESVLYPRTAMSNLFVKVGCLTQSIHRRYDVLFKLLSTCLVTNTQIVERKKHLSNRMLTRSVQHQTFVCLSKRLHIYSRRQRCSSYLPGRCDVLGVVRRSEMEDFIRREYHWNYASHGIFESQVSCRQAPQVVKRRYSRTHRLHTTLLCVILMVSGL